MIVLSLEEFAAKRRGDQERLEEALLPAAITAIERLREGDEFWSLGLIGEAFTAWRRILAQEGGQSLPARRLFTRWANETSEALRKSTPDSDPELIATWLATSVLNSATMAAADQDPGIVLEWVTMHDSDVRPAHKDAEGQQRLPGETFDVCGQQLRYPGDPTATPDCFLNCRCALAPAVPSDDGFHLETAANEGDAMDDETTEPVMEAVPWFGVLAPEGKWSGDGRMFAEGGLTNRDLPLPLTWQKTSASGHDGSTTVAKIERLMRVDGEMRASGTFLMSAEADEVIGLIAEFGRFGVSVDADSAVAEEAEEGVVFTSARIASASIVAIPAFAEAFVALGLAPDGFFPEEEFRDVPQDERDDLAEEGKAMPDGSYPIANCDDLKNAIQAIGRAKDPEAVKRHIRKRANALDCGVELPESWASETIEAKRGKGWLTHPEDTKRLHDYWTRPGEVGYAKIGWGTPGDFNRCRVLVGEKIAENSPEDMRFLNNICAQWHHDALGIWPGEHRASAEAVTDFGIGESISLVASAKQAPHEWFSDPGLTEPTALTVTDEGQIFGHLAAWGTCHIGIKDTCVEAPRSATNYGYFLTGEVVTAKGRVPVGQITIGGGHAGPSLSARRAVEHYDSTSTVVADVTCGEDEHGIWLAGQVRASATPDMVAALRASALSGDWRRIPAINHLELVAALAVNVPGFPIPRVAAGIEDAVQMSLVAAGIVSKEEPEKFNEDGIRALAAAVAKEIAAQNARKERVAALAARVDGSN